MDSTLILIVAVVSVAIGYAASTVITLSRSGKNAKDEAPAGKPAERAKEGSTQASPPVNPNRVEIVTLWRELPQGALRADFAGKTVKKTSDLTPDQRSQLKTLMAELRDWLGIAPEVSARSSAPAVPAEPAVFGRGMAVPSDAVPEDSMVSAAAAEDISARVAAVSQPVYEPKPQTDAPSSASEKKSGEIPSQPAPTPAESKAPQSIVEQIDNILQAQIKGTSLESRGIRLTESATHGVTVWIGIKAYQGMDTIPDAAVNAAIRAAVKEWEANK